MTKVIFRKDKADGTVIAFLPDYKANYGNVVCYQHQGQHGEASYEYYLDTVKASEVEYRDLLIEMQTLGYDDLAVKQRMSYSSLLDAWKL